MQVAIGAEDTLLAFLASAPPAQCLPSLLAALPSQGKELGAEDLSRGTRIHAALLGLSSLVQHITCISRPASSTVAQPPVTSGALLLNDILLRLLPQLFGLFAHTSAEVRKAVVFCLVELWEACGDEEFVQQLSPLSPAQMRLVTIYLQRRRESARDQAFG